MGLLKRRQTNRECDAERLHNARLEAWGDDPDIWELEMSRVMRSKELQLSDDLTLTIEEDGITATLTITNSGIADVSGEQSDVIVEMPQRDWERFVN